jgi:octaprenyl-diphosphate synthase
MTEGEILADQERGRIAIDEANYMDITRRKTAELFAAACAIPALFQPSTLHLTEPLAEFGRDLGICFQLVDDLLDFTAARDTMGKPVMADLREGKATLPIILLLPRLDGRQTERLQTVVSTGRFDAISVDEVLELVRTSGTLEETQRLAETYAERALERTDAFPAGPERDALARATQLLLDRGI